MLSTTAEYALRAVLFLAREGTKRPLQVGAIARALDLPRNYLGKILHELARAGVLASTRGRGGGFRLAVPADRLPLAGVVGRFDRVGEGRRCLLGRRECQDRNACAAHGRWKAVSEQVARFFQQTTVRDLLQGAPLRV